MSIKPAAKPAIAGFTLLEVVVAFGLSCIIITGIVTGFLFCSSSLYALSNYSTMSKASQNAVDQMTREIREMSTLSNYSYVSYTNPVFASYSTITNSLTFVPVGAASASSWITYYYDVNSQTLTRWQNGASNVLLTQCVFLNFSMFQRNQSNGTFVPIPTTSPAQTKLVQMSWECRQSNVATLQSQAVLAAKVVIRAK